MALPHPPREPQHALLQLPLGLSIDRRCSSYRLECRLTGAMRKLPGSDVAVTAPACAAVAGDICVPTSSADSGGDSRGRDGDDCFSACTGDVPGLRPPADAIGRWLIDGDDRSVPWARDGDVPLGDSMELSDTCRRDAL